MGKQPKISSEKVLLVEGKDELNFFEALLPFLKFKSTIQVIDVGGKDQFGHSFGWA